MSDGKIKSANGLMRHMRDSGIEIHGSDQKRDLRAIGYYHGYKGLRFFGEESDRFQFSKFSEIMSVYNFDMRLKEILYPAMMRIETGLKSHALEALVLDAGSDRFEVIFERSLTAHNAKQGSNYRKALEKRVRARGVINGILARGCKPNPDPVIWHFLKDGRYVPIWAYFELFTMGDFGIFYECMDVRVKESICKSLGLPPSAAGALSNVIWLLKDLLMKSVGVRKGECHRFLRSYRAVVETEAKELPANIGIRIVGVGADNKLDAAKHFVSRSW